MKRLIGLLLGVMLFTVSVATADPMEATTSDGRKVILFPDGTWVYKDDSTTKSNLTFTKSPEATKVLESKKGFYELWIDPTKWTEGGVENPDTEFSLKHISGDIYALTIPERLVMPISTLRNIALENARKVAPDAEIVFEEERIVNGTKVLNMRIDGTLQGIPFTYYGYYWTGQAGTLQVITFTGRNLFEELEAELTNLLNGLIITKP